MTAPDPRFGAVPGSPLAPLWRRLVAQVLDSLILVGPAFVILTVVGVDVDLEAGEIESGDRLLVAVAVIVALVVAYQTVLIARRGATIGKAAAGVRVVRADDGSIPVWDRSLLRALVPQGAGAVPVIGLALVSAVYGAALFDRHRRGIHDLAAGTIVVRIAVDREDPPAG
ncbi:MAG: RDD family protein [Actinomycetota bacterium]